MHVLRPLYVVGGLVAVILIARLFVVPADFGIQERGYMYGWYRKSNVEEWKAVKVKYQGREACKDCHAEQFDKVRGAGHRVIECENCHGPAIEHPAEPAKLPLDRSRSLCLRCHAALAYPTSQRGRIPGIDAEAHNPGMECANCHDAHKANKPK
jgi:predicted CXXCH cytochrome family protein